MIFSEFVHDGFAAVLGTRLVLEFIDLDLEPAQALGPMAPVRPLEIINQCKDEAIFRLEIGLTRKFK